MEALFAGILQNAVKFAIFIVVAVSAIICGKKFRDYKDSKKAETAENKES